MNDLETIYNYIDNRTDVERDRLLMHPLEEWYSCNGSEFGYSGLGCLVGVAEGLPLSAALRRNGVVGCAYDDECELRGFKDVVRDIKKRAGATLPTEIEHPTKPLEAVVGL